MAELVTCITCTGSRQVCLDRCAFYLNRQTYRGALQWIVVYDSSIAPTIPTMRDGIRVEVYRGGKLWRPEINTQRYNMDEAMLHVQGDKIFIFEDDDWYRNDYIENFLWLMKKFPVLGEANNRYYCLRDKKFKLWRNTQSASLCSTALTKEFLPCLDRAVNSGDLYMDMIFWRIVQQDYPGKFLLAINLNSGVGMKQLPGRGGIGAGHHVGSDFSKDENGDTLENWVGKDDATWYRDLLNDQELMTRDFIAYKSSVNWYAMSVAERMCAVKCFNLAHSIKNADGTDEELLREVIHETKKKNTPGRPGCNAANPNT